MLRNWFLLAVLSAASLNNVQPIFAADIRLAPFLDSPLASGAVLEGEIERGDCKKVRDFAYQHGTARIYLASPGDSLAEALELGRLIRTLKLQTFVPAKRGGELRGRQAADHGVKDPENLKCASACFFAFVGGIYRSQDYYFGTPALGIHRPYLSESELRLLSSGEAISAARRISIIVENYLNEMGVSTKYVDQTFSIPKDDVHWITLDQFKVDFEGVIPELKEWIQVREKVELEEVERRDEATLSTDERSLHNWVKGIMSDPQLREQFILDLLSTEYWQKILEDSDKSRSVRLSRCAHSN